MSLVQNLIKKAFATANANEAASFLASACNRMKAHNKEQIQAEVSAALVNVNLVRISEKPPQTKTVYQDSPETLRRLREAESLSTSLLAQLREAQLRSAQGDTVETTARLQRYEKQVTELQKALNISQEMHLKESALVRSVMQREIDELKSLLNRQKESGSGLLETHQREKAELHQRLEAADELIKTQQEARYKAEAEVAILQEKLENLRADNHYSFEQCETLNARLTKTIDELLATRNTLSAHFGHWLTNK
ncbi:hypothetical protein F3J28_19470 [Enterobacter sp. Ap-1006]|uniref:hypothetical protein n=1 Tax=Enterobacter sp. Ap-1006 TaxID=2608345 RepID=UPI0014231065|nr:hypothetical protein [Enterobacter sp. Ap-1006]NIF49942.1 hypothetical protein [Enterobacter sp. Ap-1006]